MKKRNLYILLIICLIITTSCSNSDQQNNVSSPKSENSETVTKANIDINEDLTLENSEIVELPSDKLRASLQQKLSSRGQGLGTVNADGSIFMIGTASTGIPSNRSGFIASRNVAFQKAELRAKIQILRLSGEEITSERNSNLVSNNIQGSDPDAVKKASIIDKAMKVVDSSLDRALEELGVSQQEISQLNQEQKEKRYSEAFNNYVSSYVGSFIKGVTVIKVVEGEVGSNDYEVAVAVKYSPEQQSEAANVGNLGASQETLNSNTVNSLRTIDTDNLVSKLGAQLFKDENGNRFVLGFGQSAVQSSDSRQSAMIDIGRRKARLLAVENIKNFLAEDLVGQEISETVEKITEFQDGTSSIYTEDNYTELIESRRTTVTLNTLNIRDWDGVHPVSNTRVVGSIVILTESNAVNFSGNTNASNTTEQSEYLESEALGGEEW